MVPGCRGGQPVETGTNLEHILGAWVRDPVCGWSRSNSPWGRLAGSVHLTSSFWMYSAWPKKRQTGALELRPIWAESPSPSCALSQKCDDGILLAARRIESKCHGCDLATVAFLALLPAQFSGFPHGEEIFLTAFNSDFGSSFQSLS